MMRPLVSPLLLVALIALTGTTLPAQRSADSATVGRWHGHAELTAPWADGRWLDIQLDIQPDGAVSGRIGDAQLDARIYRDSRVTRALGLARQYAIDGRLIGALIRSEGVQRERVHISLDCVSERMTGSLQTSGEYEGPLSERLLAGRVTLERVGPIVASHGRSARRISARVVRSPSP